MSIDKTHRKVYTTERHTETGLAEPSNSTRNFVMNNLTSSFMLSKRIPEGVSYRLDIKRTLKEEGGMIDYSHDVKDVQPWLDHPETYPTSFRNKKVYLWKTIDSRQGFRRILALSWCNGVVLLFWRKLDNMRGTTKDLLDS